MPGGAHLNHDAGFGTWPSVLAWCDDPTVRVTTNRSPYVVRAAQPSDAAAVCALVDAAYRHYIERIGTKPMPMTVDYDAAVADGAVWVAREGIGPDGALAGVLVVRHGPGHLLVENVAVDPARQGGGLGSTLLHVAESLAGERRYGEVRLFTHERMTENLAFYPRRGYVETGRERMGEFSRVLFAKQR